MKWLAVDAFKHLEATTNARYAWSAQSPDGSITILTLWEDEVDDDGQTVLVDFFDHPKVAVSAKHFNGSNDRKVRERRRRYVSLTSHLWRRGHLQLGFICSKLPQCKPKSTP